MRQALERDNLRRAAELLHDRIHVGHRADGWLDAVVAEAGAAWQDVDAAFFEEAQLGEYFARQRTVFAVKLDLLGTPFQVEVWNSLARIPYGETTSYGQQAKWVGRPAAVRAVGGANGRNPVAIVLPCHRVVGANGSLTGFGGGVERKIWLLDHEKN